MAKKSKKKAVSLVEILVSAVLLSLVVGGLTSVFLTVRRHIRHAKERSTAAGLSLSHSRTLHEAVRADTWGSSTNDLYPGTTSLLDYTIDNITYTPNQYAVSNTSYQYREVEIKYGYPD